MLYEADDVGLGLAEGEVGEDAGAGGVGEGGAEGVGDADSSSSF